MNKNREKVNLSEHFLRSILDEDYNAYDEDEILEYDFIEAYEIYHDLEKGYEDYDVIIKRKSDNKYFKFDYSTSNYHDIFSDSLGWDWKTSPIAYEVFPKKVTTIEYE